ncbi:MAG: hypothetical protein BroJett018_07050 [Chloroflexota bacterium]|nr:hypothetical protein [Chloroflexota bacterium]GIK62911.1 MAG: hypothetical protein BroJett018_07050 [Chloroflexota bacterium]
MSTDKEDAIRKFWSVENIEDWGKGPPEEFILAIRNTVLQENHAIKLWMELIERDSSLMASKVSYTDKFPASDLSVEYVVNSVLSSTRIIRIMFDAAVEYFKLRKVADGSWPAHLDNPDDNKE